MESLRKGKFFDDFFDIWCLFHTIHSLELLICGGNIKERVY